MKKFIFLHYGYETPTQEIMNAWNNWFASVGDKIIDKGGPCGAGREISKTGTAVTSAATSSATILESTTILLVGTVLVGLGRLSRRKFKRSC